MFQERTRMSAAHEANTQRLMSALRDKESALQVRQWLLTHHLISYAPINSNRSLLFRLLFKWNLRVGFSWFLELGGFQGPNFAFVSNWFTENGFKVVFKGVIYHAKHE